MKDKLSLLVWFKPGSHSKFQILGELPMSGRGNRLDGLHPKGALYGFMVYVADILHACHCVDQLWMKYRPVTWVFILSNKFACKETGEVYWTGTRFALWVFKWLDSRSFYPHRSRFLLRIPLYQWNKLEDYCSIWNMESLTMKVCTHSQQSLNTCTLRWDGFSSIKMPSWLYRDSEDKDKTVVRPSYLYHGNPNS